MNCESANKNSLIIIIFLIFIDQLTKYIIRSFGGFYICNKGIAFGIALPTWLILFSAIAVILSIIILNLNSKFSLPAYPVVLIISGAISNLIDRLSYGCVIDFINMKIWPVFNLADIFICLGVFLLIFKLDNKRTYAFVKSKFFSSQD